MPMLILSLRRTHHPIRHLPPSLHPIVGMIPILSIQIVVLVIIMTIHTRAWLTMCQITMVEGERIHSSHHDHGISTSRLFNPVIAFAANNPSKGEHTQVNKQKQPEQLNPQLSFTEHSIDQGITHNGATKQ